LISFFVQIKSVLRDSDLQTAADQHEEVATEIRSSRKVDRLKKVTIQEAETKDPFA